MGRRSEPGRPRVRRPASRRSPALHRRNAQGRPANARGCGERLAGAAPHAAPRRGGTPDAVDRRGDRGDGQDPPRRSNGRRRDGRRDPRANRRNPAPRRGASRHACRRADHDRRRRPGVARPGHDRGDGPRAARAPLTGCASGRRRRRRPRPALLAGDVGRILDGSEDELAEPVAELVAHAFLEELPRTGEVDFRNQLVRDAIYGAIPAGERRRLHGIVAGLADGSSDGSGVQASGHYELAGRTADAYRTALVEARRGGPRVGAPRGDGALPPSGPQRAGRAAAAERGRVFEDLGREEATQDATTAAASSLAEAHAAYVDAGDRLSPRPGWWRPWPAYATCSVTAWRQSARSRGELDTLEGLDGTGGGPGPGTSRGCARGRALRGTSRGRGPGARGHVRSSSPGGPGMSRSSSTPSAR